MRFQLFSPTMMVSWIALLCLVLGACESASGIRKTPRVEPSVKALGVPKEVDDEFQSAVRRWSRHHEIYSTMDAQVFFYGTLLTPEFLSSLRKRDASVGGDVSGFIPPSDDCAPAIFLGTYFHDSHLEDFGHHQSIWKIRLTTPEGEWVPTKIHRISRPDRRLRASFPYLDRFWTAYAMVFGPGNHGDESSSSASLTSSSDETASGESLKFGDAASSSPSSSSSSSSRSVHEEKNKCSTFSWSQAALTIQSVAGAAKLDFSAH